MLQAAAFAIQIWIVLDVNTRNLLWILVRNDSVLLALYAISMASANVVSVPEILYKK